MSGVRPAPIASYTRRRDALRRSAAPPKTCMEVLACSVVEVLPWQPCSRRRPCLAPTRRRWRRRQPDTPEPLPRRQPAPAGRPKGRASSTFPRPTPRPGTLQLLFTHRFSEPVEDSDIHSLYSFDSGADVGHRPLVRAAHEPRGRFPLPVVELRTYELDAKYRLFATDSFAAAVRAGGDWTDGARSSRIASASSRRQSWRSRSGRACGSRSIPTYVSTCGRNVFVGQQPFHENVRQSAAALCRSR